MVATLVSVDTDLQASGELSRGSPTPHDFYQPVRDCQELTICASTSRSIGLAAAARDQELGRPVQSGCELCDRAAASTSQSVSGGYVAYPANVAKGLTFGLSTNGWEALVLLETDGETAF
jgi:hypothetical protein